MIVFRRQEQRRLANVVQSIANVETPQELQTIDVPVASGMRRQLDELLHLRAMRVRRVQPERREVPHQRHGAPRKDREAGNGQPQSDLRCEVGERVQDDEGPDVLRVPEREGQRDGTAERFADDNRTTFDRRDDVDDAARSAANRSRLSASSRNEYVATR